MERLGPYLLGPNDENQGIYTGDARELARAIPDESIDLIFTDPVYQNIDNYRWLAETAANVLKLGGMVIAQTCSEYRWNAENVMRGSGLDAQPLLSEWLTAPTAFYKFRLSQMWKPYLWFAKGKRGGGWVLDSFRGGGVSKDIHLWGDSTAFFLEYTYRLTEPDSVIFDAFTGGGTVPAVCKMLGRRWLAFEIDPDTAERARERVRNTQPPLFVMEPEQMEMGF